MIRTLNESVAVAPQIRPEDVAAIKAAGYAAIVNNRPDGEEPGQPTGDSIRAAAEDQGLAYTAIPVTPGGFSHEMVDQMTQALVEAKGRCWPIAGRARAAATCGHWRRPRPDATRP